MTDVENTNRVKITMSASKANVYSILIILPIFIIYYIPYYLINFTDSTIPDFKNSINTITLEYGFLGLPLLIIGVTIIGIVVHELIHGIFWSYFAKNGYKSIKFGIVWKAISPYCHCREPLLVKEYIIGAIMPGVILGLIPTIYSIINDNLEIFAFGTFFTLAAGGDIILIYLLRNEKMNSRVQDHPSEVGCYVYRE